MVDQKAGIPVTDSPLYADVIVPRHLTGPFTYRVPRSLGPSVRIGQLVLVPFGRSLIQGAVTSLSHTAPRNIALERLKEIRALAAESSTTEIPPGLLRLARQVSDSCVAPWGQCLRLVLPPHGPAKRDPIRFLLTELGHEALTLKQTHSAEVTELLARLKRRPNGLTARSLRDRKSRTRDTVLASLVEQGWIEKILPTSPRESQIPRIPPTRFKQGSPGSAPCLTMKVSPSVQSWEERIRRVLEPRRARRLLIQAPLEKRLAMLAYAQELTVGSGRTVLVIVGESDRADSIAAFLSEHGATGTTCFHSALPLGEKTRVWEQALQHRSRLIVGTRSAAFLPISQLGLIWIEQEEDPSLKEPQEPRYHARDVAWLRVQDEQALLVLSSGHLAVETREAGEEENMLLSPPWRDGMPSIELVDLRHERREAILSIPLVESIRDTLNRRTGVLLFLNRKGYAGALICKECGQAPRCVSCQLALGYHRRNNLLLCSYCGRKDTIPDLCPTCASPRLVAIGAGTERVEGEIHRLFPQAKVLRIDGETMGSPKEVAAMWARIQQREWDVLIGTQVLLREDLVPPVGLVGVVHADAGLNRPDFRAAERTYHHLIGAMNLALPSSMGGRIVLQSYLPSHHAIQAVCERDEKIFLSEELSQRAALGFPPAVHLILLSVSGPDEPVIEQAASAWVTGLLAQSVRSAAEPGTVSKTDRADLIVLGPSPSPVPKVRGSFHRRILIKSLSRESAILKVRATVAELERTYSPRRAKFDIDVDPVEMS